MNNIPNECGFCRPKEHCAEAEKVAYQASTFDSLTMYCHHLDSLGRHIVVNNLPLDSSRNCKGIIYYSLSFKGKQLKCGCKRADPSTHDPCNKLTCPYVRDGFVCPFSV